MAGSDLKLLEVRMLASSTAPIFNYTGKIAKAILLTEVPELQPTFRPVKGFFKTIRVSPLIRDGTAVTPVFELKRVEGKITYELKPVQLSGNYVFEIGGTSDDITLISNKLKQAQGFKTRLKFENAIFEYIIEEVVERDFNITPGKYVNVASVSPALLTTPYSITQHVRRFTISPSILLWVPYLISQGILSVTEDVVRKATKLLETCLVEHYSSRAKVVHIPYDGRREPALQFKVRYIVLCEERERRDALKDVLKAARVLGVGASRANGFGTIQLS